MAKSIYSNDGEIKISIRETKKYNIIYISKHGLAKKSTGKKATQQNIKYYQTNGVKAWNELVGEDELKKRSIKFKEFVPIALKHINRDVTKSTTKDRESRVERFLIPYFGKKELSKITALQVEEWQYNMLKTRGADQTKRTKQLLRQILDRGIVHELLKVNVVTSTSKMREPRIDMREVYTKEEIKKMLDNSDGWLHLFILTMVSLGLRSGEIIALKFSDIDFNEGTIKIQRSIRHSVVSTTKTGISRIIEIPLSLLKKLKQAYDKKGEYQEYIFVTPNGRYWGDCSHITRRHFKPLLEKVGVNYKTLYSLRHTYATLSLQGGQTVNYVSKQLGHADTTTTLQYYVKYLKDEETIKRADKILSF